MTIKKNASGFTIIEVLIVLAIAGVIISIVFLAIPALQRVNRNYQRRDYAGKVFAAINQYKLQNNGVAPFCYNKSDSTCPATAQAGAAAFLTSSMPTAAVDDYDITSTQNVTTSFCHGEANQTQTVVFCWDDRSATKYIDHSYAPEPGQVIIDLGHTCGENTGTTPFGDHVIKDPTKTGQGSFSKNSVAVLIGIEGGNGYFCAGT